MRGLAGRNVLLTGGAGGIGRATAVRLAEEGCRVGVLGINPGGIGGLWFRQADITDRPSVEAAVAAFENEIGPVDFLANIARF